MRGAQKGGQFADVDLGIIPADAGSTREPTLPADSAEDHPRGCGEHSAHLAVFLFVLGSSPRLRGARCHRIRTPAYHRIIPADAGSTPAASRPPDRIGRRGIIPADAGSTVVVHLANAVFKDHPRGCGEHWTRCARGSTRHGSSPRMRGAHTIRSVPDWVPRIIPADAGSTRCISRIGHIPWDHPRGCGEHSGEPLHLSQVVGSSPRMRGAPSRPSQDWKVRGIIPADAGSTCQQPEPGSAGGDHPRGCGEHSSQSSSFTCEVGSSPRMRGALRGYLLLNQLHRIIPADAGSTS